VSWFGAGTDDLLISARAVHFACLKRGIVDIYDRGMHVVRWQPALTMPSDMFTRACDLLEDAIAAVEAGR